MISLVTLLAVWDMTKSVSSAGPGVGGGEVRPGTDWERADCPEFLPKLSFHLEGFLGRVVDEGGGAIDDRRVLLTRAGGMA